MRKFLPFVAYAILILVVFWDVLVPPEGKILFGLDITRYHYFQRGFLGMALREGQIPWWNPYIMMGVPYLEHPQIPVWYPPNLLFVALPANVAVPWYIMLHIFIAMTGMYVLLRNISPLPAWAAGIAYGFSAYFVARIPAGHIDIIAASSWAPWVMWTFTRRSVVLSALALSMQLLAGQPMAAVFTLEAVAIVTLIRSGMTGVVRMALSVALGLGLAAIQLLPNAQYISRSIRTFPFPDSWAQLGTPTIVHLLEFLDPFYFYDKLPDSGFGFEHVGYIGKAPLLFAVVAIIAWVVTKKKARWEIPAFGLVAVFGLWMWLGNNAPFDLFSWVRSWFPLYSQIRIPARHVMLFVLSASVLFGFGLSLVKAKVIQLLVVALVLADLVPLARRHLTLTSVPEAAEDRELVKVLTNHKSLYRFLPNFYHGDSLREALEFNAPIAHKIFSVSGYDTPPLRNYYEFLLAVNGYEFNDVIEYSESIPPFRNLGSRYINFLNIKYILTPKGLNENKNAFPRFFIATKIQTEPDRDALLQAIGQGSVDPAMTVIVDGSTVDTSGFSPDCPPEAKGDVRVHSYGYGKISLTAQSPCNAFLATSEIMYPGWTATIDGKPVSVFEGNAAFRTLYLPAGNHEVVFTYRPIIILVGASISLISLGAIAFAARRGI